MTFEQELNGVRCPVDIWRSSIGRACEEGMSLVVRSFQYGESNADIVADETGR